MKQKMILTVLVLAFAVLAGLVLAYIDESAPAKTPDNSAMSVAAQEASIPTVPAPSLPIAAQESSVDSVSEAPQRFVLGEYDGWLAVYAADAPEPVKIYDVLVQTLPAYDRERLSAGIAAADEAALALLLEDYIS